MDEDATLENLMAKAQKGDKAAYRQVFQEILPRLRSFVGNKLNRAEDAEDVVQEILISIHKASHTYDPARSFNPWMYAIASYRVSDFLRSHYRKGDERGAVDFDDLSHSLPNEKNVTNSYETNEYLEKALEKLPKKQSKILRMMKIKGYSVAETAKTMDMSESAVKVSSHRAMKTLAAHAEKDEI